MFVILFDPRGLKRFSRRRLVSGAGDIKLTKDGNVLLHEMVRVDVILWACVILCETPPTLSLQQIQHPTASLIAKVATAQVSHC